MKVIFQFRWLGPKPRVDEVCRRFGLTPDDLDPEYGVIETDELEHLYTVLADEDAEPRVTKTLSESERTDPLIHFFANVRQEPLGRDSGDD